VVKSSRRVTGLGVTYLPHQPPGRRVRYAECLGAVLAKGPAYFELLEHTAVTLNEGLGLLGAIPCVYDLTSNTNRHDQLAPSLRLSDHHDVDARIKKAAQASGALRDRVFSSRDIPDLLKGKVYAGGVLAVLPYGCESWCLTAEAITRLYNWHNRPLREMYRVAMC
jgi:hypothetical protein